MQKYFGPVWQDTIHDQRARGVVVSQPYRKLEEESQRERRGGERERERREGTPVGREIAERGFDPRSFGL